MSAYSFACSARAQLYKPAFRPHLPTFQHVSPRLLLLVHFVCPSDHGTYITLDRFAKVSVLCEMLVGTIRSLSLQMAFAKRFNEFTCDITHISSLEENRQYPIERADRVKTRFGEAILLSVRDVEADRLCKVFLPQRYTAVFKDDDVLQINDGFAVWHLVSKGRCPDYNAYQLAIE